MSSQLCPGAWQPAGMEVSIVALIWIRSTFLPLFGLLMPPHSKCAEVASRSSMFRGKKEGGGQEGGAIIMLGHFSGVFWRVVKDAGTRRSSQQTRSA